MGDSDDDWNSANVSGAANNNNNSGGTTGSGGGGGGPGGAGAYNSNNNGGGGNKRNRDKFYRERDDSANSSGGGGNMGNGNGNGNYRRGGGDWNDRNRNNDWKNRGGNPGGGGGGGMMPGYQGNNNYQRMDYTRKYTNPNYSGPSDNTSPQMYKKTRKDWDMGGGSHSSGGMDSYGSGGGGGYGGAGGGYGSMGGSGMGQNPYQKSPDYAKSQPNSEYPTQPPLLPFKHFLQQQDDGISEEEAFRRYNEYKIEFKKTQINNFFLEHKEEDWFKSRYYPDESVKRRSEQNQCILNRLETFMNLYNEGHLNNVAVEADKSKDLIKFLDAVVIKLEGGNDEDIKLLDAPASASGEEEAGKEKKSNENDEEMKSQESTNGEGENGKTAQKRKSEDSGSESGAYSESDNDDDKTGDHRRKKKSKSDAASSAPKSTTTGVKQLHRTASIFMRNLAPSVTKQDLEDLCKTHDGFKRVALSDPAPDRGFFRRGWITFESNVDVKKICWSLQNIKIRGFNPGAIVNRELTSRARSISNLVSHHKSVVKNDIKIAMKIIQNMDKRWNLWQTETIEEEKEPEKEKEKDEDKEGENGENSGVNPEDAVFNKSVLNTPQFLKHKFNGSNPLLENITDYLVDEVDAEEEELLGDAATGEVKEKTSKSNNELEIDRSYIQALDKLILYLRVVHSLDFYNAIEYQQEDSMPNRCGIIFVRPALPVNAATASLKIREEEVTEYSQQFETKMKPYTEYKERIDLDLAKKLGLKDIREEVEKFIKVNTEELAPDRWLCPLSGKKFKGPEFIRKHLFYKHLDKINEVKKEVEFFNSYLFDPKRPQLPEHPSNKLAQSNASFSSASAPGMQQAPGFGGNAPLAANQFASNPGIMGSPMLGQMYGMMGNRPMNQQWQPFMSPDMMQAAYANFNQQFGGGAGGGGGGGGQFQGYKNKAYGYGGGGFRRGRDSREMIQYKDLDAPDDN